MIPSWFCGSAFWTQFFWEESLFLVLLARFMHIYHQQEMMISLIFLDVGRDRGGNQVMYHLSASLGSISWWHSQCSQEQPERASSTVWEPLKSQFVSHLLLSHWPKQVTWLSPEYMGDFPKGWIWEQNYGDFCTKLQ